MMTVVNDARVPGFGGKVRIFLGLLRSLVIYRARWWRIDRLARHYGEFLSPGDLAFDVGAHVGNRSLAMHRAGARVIALEPQSPFRQFLARTMPDGVTVLACAAGEEPGEASLSVSSLHPTVSSLAEDFGIRMQTTDPGFRRVTWDRRETVHVETLDGLIAAYGLPRLIKIDVEGFEDKVLAGLTQPVETIAFEVLPAAPDVLRRSVARLQTLGPYRFAFLANESLGFATGWIDGDALIRAVDAQGRTGDVYARLAL